MSGLTPTQMEALSKWMSSPAAEKDATTAKTAKAKALKKLKKLYPNVDTSKFETKANFDSKKDVTADVLFKEGPVSLQSVFLSDRQYWSEEIKNALGLEDFPFQLTLRPGEVLPIPAVGDSWFANQNPKKDSVPWIKHLRYRK